MTSHSMSFGRPLRRHPAVAAQLFGQATAWLLQSLQQLDRWQLGLRPEPAQTAEDVLNWATRLEASEPGFASDLRAAALRSMSERKD